MSRKQEELRESIRAKSDRELQETIAYFSNENEKHLRNISSVATWVFWFMIISIILGVVAIIA